MCLDGPDSQHRVSPGFLLPEWLFPPLSLCWIGCGRGVANLCRTNQEHVGTNPQWSPSLVALLIFFESVLWFVIFLFSDVYSCVLPGCRCNAIGSLSQSCSKLGGFCECKVNVIGRCCDTCAPLTFDFGPDGCKRNADLKSKNSFYDYSKGNASEASIHFRTNEWKSVHDNISVLFAACECDPLGSLSELCDQVSGQCTCRSKVTGRQCSCCQNGFWGFPFCQPCECNGLSEVCDEETGECMNCKEHTTGPHCDRL